MKITGTAVKVHREQVVSPCGFVGPAGYRPVQSPAADAELSFMPKTHKVLAEVPTLTIGGESAIVVKATASEHIPGMWTFLIKYQE